MPLTGCGYRAQMLDDLAWLDRRCDACDLPLIPRVTATGTVVDFCHACGVYAL